MCSQIDYFLFDSIYHIAALCIEIFPSFGCLEVLGGVFDIVMNVTDEIECRKEGYSQSISQH